MLKVVNSIVSVLARRFRSRAEVELENLALRHQRFATILHLLPALGRQDREGSVSAPAQGDSAARGSLPGSARAAVYRLRCQADGVVVCEPGPLICLCGLIWQSDDYPDTS